MLRQVCFRTYTGFREFRGFDFQLDPHSGEMCFCLLVERTPTRQTAAILQTHVACGTHGIAGPILPPISVAFDIELSRSIKSHLVSRPSIQGGPKIGAIFVCRNFIKY